MKRLVLLSVFVLSALLHAGLVITLENGRQIDLYSDYYAIIIGNSEYQHYPKLRGVKQDVVDIRAMFERMGISTLTLQDQTGTQMQKALNDFVDVHGKDPHRALILYFAGHGFTEKRADGSSLGYILPVDAPLYEKSPGEFRNKAVSMTKIIDLAEMVISKHVLLMFDSCFSGTLFTAKRAVPQIIDEKTSMPVRQFITAGSADEAVPDISVFKTTLLKGLGDGFADLNRDGYITGEELGSYLENEVVNYSRGAQHPKYGRINNPNLDRGDFVFALAKAPAIPAPPLVQPSSPVSTPEPVTTLERLTGNLRITSDFEAEVFLEQKPMGTVKPGYALLLKNLGTGRKDLEFFTSQAKYTASTEVRYNETATLDIKLNVLQGKGSAFTLKSIPPSATFSLEAYPGV
ncbi:MAG TPA: caspase family protein, partial [Candidatus Cloacimonadota bacterium]|nr:caspase family protein [Candidatus Cloacimonadota bacterium]